jgi:RNA polymerase sigma-70 factor (ECF subfamily)
MFAGVLEQGRALAGQIGSDVRGITQPFRSVLRDSPKVPPPTFNTDAAANRYYRDKSVSPGSVMFSQTNQADKRAQVMKDLANAPPAPPTFMANPRKYVEGMTLGTAGQLSDMFSSIPKSVLGSAVYNYARLYDELFTKVPRADSVKNAQALKDKWPQQLNAPWSVVAKSMGPEAQYFYENNPVAFVMHHIGKGIETAAGGAGAASGVPVGDIMNLADATMGWLGVAGVKKGVTSSVKARTAQLRGALEPKAPAVPGGVEPTLEGALAPELAPAPAPAAPALGMGARVRGALEGVRQDFREASAMGTDAVAAAAEAVAVSKARIAALTPETAVDLTEALPAAPTKAELKAQTAAVDSLVVDKAKLQEIFGLAARKGPAAEAALVQNIFDRVLKPVTKVEPPPVVESRVPYDATTFPPGAGLKTTLPKTPVIIGEPVKPDLVTSGLDKLRQGLLISTPEAKAIRGLQVRAGEGVIVDQSGKPLFQRGAADPSLLKVLGLMGLGAVAANQIYDWWNSSSGLSEDKARDVGMGLAAAGAAGVMKPKGGMWHPFAVPRLAGPLAESLTFYPNLGVGAAAVRAPGEPLHFGETWANNAVTKWLNKEAGTAADRAKDIVLPNGQTLESVTDQAFGSAPAGDYASAAAARGAKYGLRSVRQGSQSAIPGLNKLIQEGKVSLDEPIYQVATENFDRQYGHQGDNVAYSASVLSDYLSHVGDYMRSLNLTPEKLQQYDLPRAMQETTANDARIAAQALKDFTKPNPIRIADTQALPVYEGKSYPSEMAPARTFSFNRDGSIRKMESIDLPAGEVQYTWHELKLPDALTPEQASRILPLDSWGANTAIGRVPPDMRYKAVDAKGKVIIDNFSEQPAVGRTPEEAHLAGQMAQEGNALGHCVGGYCTDVLDGSSRIISLRDQLGRSYATVELKQDPLTMRALRGDIGEASRVNAQKMIAEGRERPRSIAQIKGPGNGAPADYVKPYVQDFVKSGKWSDVKDLDNAGLLPYKTAMGGIDPYTYKLGTVDYQAITLEPGYYTKAELADAYAKAGGEIDPRYTDQRGAAKPEQLALLAGGAAAAAYLANDPNPDTLANLSMALGAGVIAARGGKFADLPEGKLIETFRAGGREGEAAAAQIWEDTHRQLGRTIGNMNRQLDEAGIQDISQRVYEKVFKALKQSPDEPGGFRGDAKLSTFLHGVASNEVKNSFAAASRRPATDSMTVDAEGTTAVPEKYMMEQNPERYQSAEDITANNQLAQQMQKALDKLPEDSRALFESIEMEGLSYQEAADRFGIPIGTVRSRVSRAKDALSQSLRQYRTQGGKIDADAVIALGALGSGVALGAYLDSDNPIRGGVLGAIGVAGFGAMAKGKPGNALDYTLGLTSTRLGGVSQPLLRRARDYERTVMERTDRALDAVTPFIKGIKKLPAAAADALNLALLRNDPGEIAAAIKGNPALVAGYRQVQNLLAAFRAEQISMGRFAAGVNEYFPRVVKDLEGLKEALNQPMRTHLETLLAKAEADMIKTRGRGMTDVERSLVVNRALQTVPPNAALPGFARARSVDVTADLAPFYLTPTESLLRYIVGAVEDAEVAKFFGKDLASNKLASGQLATNVDKSIGNLVQTELAAGKISPEQQLEIKSILESRFKAGEQQMGGFLQDVRNATNLGLLGNFASAATQIGDSMMTAYHHNLMPTLSALRMKLTGSSQITTKEFGLVNHIAEEMGSTRLSGKAVQTVFKYTGFSAIDQFAKGLNLNAALIKNQKLAQTPKGQAALAERWGQAFGPEFPQLLADLAGKRMSEPVKSLLFSELSNTQPITKLEVPQAYLDHPNGRILYQMKTYMLKQIDVVRRDAYQEIAKGNYVKGARNLVGLAAALSLANIPGDLVKDMLAGRPIDLDKIDYVENLLQNFGINHYTMGKINRETLAKGVKEFAVGAVTPPSLSILSDLDKPERLIKYIPGVGRPLYDREFGGNEARKWAELVQAKRKERDRLEEASPALKAERLRKAEAIKRKRNEAMQALP